MTPEFKTLLDALDELNGLLEADALPDVCIPRSIHIEVLLAAIPGDHSEHVPLAVARALGRMAKSMDLYRERWMVRLHAKTTSLQ